MILYVAGPMRGYPDYNYPAFHEEAIRLRSEGHTVICPAESFGGDQRLGMDAYARFDLHCLLQVEGVVLLDGWGKSVGACTEVAVGRWLGLKFYYRRTDGDLGEFLPLNPTEEYAAGFRGKDD